MYGIYDLILITDIQGKLIATNDITPNKKSIETISLYSRNFKNEPWFKSVIEGKFTVDEKNGFNGTYTEDPNLDSIVSEAYGEKRYGTSFSAAIKDLSGKVIGVISTRAGSRWFELEFQKLYETLRTNGIPDAEMTMINKDGVILVDYDPFTNSNKVEVMHNYDILGKFNLVEKGSILAKELVNKKNGSGVFLHSRKNINQVAGYTPIIDSKFVPSLGWGVMVRANEKTVFEKIILVQELFYIISGVIILLALLISYKISISISNSLQMISGKLSEASQQVSSAAMQIAASSGRAFSGQ